MSAPTAPPRLYHFRISHFNEKVRWALDHKRWPHHRTALLPAFHMLRALWVSRQTATPVLVLDGRAVTDSTRIIAELERLRPDPPLYPADPEARKRALEIEERFDEEVAPDARRLAWATFIDDARTAARVVAAGAGAGTRLLWRALFPLLRPLIRREIGLSPEQVKLARSRMSGHFDFIEATLSPAGYLVGDSFTVADLTAAAILSPIVRPPQFSYPLAQPWPQGLSDLRAEYEGRRGFRWVLEMFERHRGASAEITAHGR